MGGPCVAEDNDLEVAKQLGRLEATLDRIEVRLFGDGGDPDGGVIGQHDKRIAKLERLVIIVASALGVFNFITGVGPFTFSGIYKLLGGK